MILYQYHLFPNTFYGLVDLSVGNGHLCRGTQSKSSCHDDGNRGYNCMEQNVADR